MIETFFYIFWNANCSKKVFFAVTVCFPRASIQVQKGIQIAMGIGQDILVIRLKYV